MPVKGRNCLVCSGYASRWDTRVPKWEGYARFCSLARGLDVIGERWTLVILQELLHAPRRYSELRSLLPGIGSNVLSDRLRSLERHGLVERVPGSIGEGVVYALAARGRQLGPAISQFRQWGLDVMLPPAGEQGLPYVSDLSYAIPPDLSLHEWYEWHIDEGVYALEIADRLLTVDRGSAPDPCVVLTTTRAFLRRWVAGTATWDLGRASGEVTVQGTADAWERMLLATGYPGRPANSADRVRAQQQRPTVQTELAEGASEQRAHLP